MSLWTKTERNFFSKPKSTNLKASRKCQRQSIHGILHAQQQLVRSYYSSKLIISNYGFRNFLLFLLKQQHQQKQPTIENY